jgi:hypothetical protein
MTDLLTKVGAAHLGRDAYVYVRQSTLTQVREHTESLERQYELADRAMTLGWPPRQVVIVDDDLGRSGAESSAREGFKSLVADVGLGKVGIILGKRCPAWPATTPTGISCSTYARSPTPSSPTATACITRLTSTTGWCWA